MMAAETKKKPAKKKADPTLKRRREELEIRQAEVELRRDELTLERQERDAAWQRHADRSHGVFRLETYVNGGAVDLAADIQQFSRAHPGQPITLYITSPGGSLFAGWALYDTLRTASSQGHEVVTVLRGYAASMAGVLYLAGDTRLIGSEAHLMIHEVSAGAIGKVSEMEDEVELCKQLNRRIEDVYVARTKIKRADFRKKSTRRDWWIAPEACISLGIAHAIG